MELAERREYRKAARCFEREIRRNPENYTAYINGVLILFRSGQYNKALRYANRSIEIAPAESMAHLNKGALLSEVDDHRHDPQLRIGPSMPIILQMCAPKHATFV